MSNETGLIKILKWPFLGNWRTIYDYDYKIDKQVPFFRVPLPGIYPTRERGKPGNTAREIIWIPTWQFLLLLFCQGTSRMAWEGSILGVFICGAITLYLTLGFVNCGIARLSPGIFGSLFRAFLLLERCLVLYTFIHAWRMLS